MNDRLLVSPPDVLAFEHPLGSAEVVIGRAQTAGLVVPDVSVSRFHVRVFPRDGGWCAEDLGARNGTLLNGEPLVGVRRFADGDRLTLGGTIVAFASTTVAADPIAAIVQPAAEALPDRQAARLRTLNDVHRALATPISLSELLDLILDRCFDALHPEEGVILLRGANDDWVPAATKQSSGATGGMLVSRRLSDEVAGRAKPALVVDALMDERFAGADSIMMSGVRSVVAAPLVDAGGSLGMVALGSRVGVRQFSQEDLDMLVSIASVAALRVRNVALAEEAAARKVLARELALAHDMQMSMLPRRLPTRASIDLSMHLTPARSVGGDLYDFVEEGHRLWFIVADVSGKGVAAALVMAVVKTLFRAMVPGETDLVRVLTRMNDELCRDNDQMIFVTAVVGCLDLDTGQVTMGDIGHNPAFVVKGDKGDATVIPVDVPKSIAFGVFPNAAFESGSLTLAAGDVLVLYTDGVTDARSVSGEMFGAERLEAALHGAGRQSAAGVLGQLRGRVEAFAAGAPPEDDITIMVLRYLG